MPKLRDRGAIQFIVLLILLAGLLGGLYLVQHPQIFKPKAGGGLSAPIGPFVGFKLSSDAVLKEVTVTVEANSDFDSANLFVAKLKFNKDLLRVNKIDTSSPFIKNWTEQFYDNSTGEISLIGGIPNPGIQTNAGEAGKMAVIYLTPLKAGSADISFDDQSAIYRNSDNVNILTVKQGTTISIGVDEGSYSTPSYSTPSYGTPSYPTPSYPTPGSSTPPASPVPGTGDGNGDGKIDLVDLSILLSDFNKRSGFRKGIDLNGDEVINTFDFSLMRNLLIQRGVIRG